MKFSFSGTLICEFRLRLLGTSIKRQLQVNYKYMPPWSYWDSEIGVELTGTESLSLEIDFEILAQPRAERGMGLRGAELEPYWTSARELLVVGVLNRHVYDQIDAMVDADARLQDQERRQKAQSGGTLSLPNRL